MIIYRYTLWLYIDVRYDYLDVRYDYLDVRWASPLLTACTTTPHWKDYLWLSERLACICMRKKSKLHGFCAWSFSYFCCHFKLNWKRIMGAQLRAHLKTLNTIVMLGKGEGRGFRMCPMIPRNASLSNSCTSDRWSFSSVIDFVTFLN